MDFLSTSLPSLALQAHSSPVQSLAYNSDGRFLATGDTSRTLRAWFDAKPFLDANVQSTEMKVRAIDRIRGLAFSKDGQRLYVACGDTLRCFDLVRRAETWSYQPPRSLGFLVTSPVAVTVSPAGNVLTVSDAGLVTMLDPEGRILNKWTDNEAPRHVCFTGDGVGVVGADGFSVSVWEAYSGKRLNRLRTRERIYGMALDTLRQVLATRTLHYVELIDIRTLKPLERVPAPAGLPLIGFSPDGGVLAMGGKEEVLLLELASKKCVVLPLHSARVLSLAYHPDGTRLTAGCSDGVVRFWELMPKAA